MQHLEGSGTPVLYIGRTVLKGYEDLVFLGYQWVISSPYSKAIRCLRLQVSTCHTMLLRNGEI
jgi:hypothetical protein